MEKQSVKSEIKKAFMQLLTQKAYMEITVSDLVKKAQVSRMSFYRNFNSMDDVIDSIADEMIIAPPITDTNNERKWREFVFEILYRGIQVQKTLGVSFQDFEKAHKNNSVIMDRIHDKVVRAEKDLPTKTAIERYTAIGKMNLIQGIVREWIISGMQETPEEIVNIVLPMIMKL